MEPLAHKYARPLLLGAVDGLITTFVVITGGMASGTGYRSILAIGVSSLLADGVSMGVSEGISAKSEGDGVRPAPSHVVARGASCTFGFVSFGSAPFFAYVFTANALVVTLVFFAFLALAGGFRARITREPPSWAVVEVVGLGSVAGAVAYAAAAALRA